MAPLFNTTLVCNTTASCASALDKVQEQYEDVQRLSYILGALLSIIFLLLVCSPLIFDLPRDRDDDDNNNNNNKNNRETRQAPRRPHPHPPPPPPPPENDGIEMQDLEGRREMPSPGQFAIGGEDSPTPSAQPSLPDPDRFRSVYLGGERFHIHRSDATLLAETGILRGAGDEQELARRCVDEARAPSPAGESVHALSSPRERPAAMADHGAVEFSDV